MSIDVTGIEDMKANIDRISKAVDDAARIAVVNGGHLIERRAKMLAPVQTGTLRRSIHVEATQLGPGKWQSITGPSVIYGRFREFGGTIRPRNASSLAWKNTGAAAGAYGASTVLPPGQSVTQRGKPYMRPAFDQSISALRDVYRAAFREALDL